MNVVAATRAVVVAEPWRSVLLRAWRAVLSWSSEPVETITSVTLMIYGCWIAVPVSDSFGVSIAYKTMGELAPELVWGLAFVAIGAFGCASVIRGDRQLCSRFLVMSTWSSLAGFFAVASSFESAGTAMFLSMSIWSGWALYRVERKS